MSPSALIRRYCARLYGLARARRASKSARASSVHSAERNHSSTMRTECPIAGVHGAVGDGCPQSVTVPPAFRMDTAVFQQGVVVGDAGESMVDDPPHPAS